jgi:PAS domain S-box-containing protein
VDTLEHAFDHVQIGLALIAGDTTILRVNPAGASILGRGGDELLGEPFIDLAHPDDLDRAMAELASLVAAGHAGPIQLRLRHADGTWRAIRAHATRLPRDDFVGFVVFEDVTAELAIEAALAVERDRSARRFAQQQAVAELGRLALSGLTPVQVAQRATELVLESLGARSAVVFFDDGHPDGLLQVAGAGPSTRAVGSYRRPRDELLSGLVRSRQARFVPDVLDPGSSTEAQADDARRRGIRSVVLSPVVPGHAPPGLLLATHGEPEAFTPDDATFLEAVANVLATTLDTTRSIDDLRHQAQHDSLTGAAQPCPAARPPGGRPRPLAPAPRRGRGAHLRHRPLQGRQRRARPCRGGRGAPRRRRAPGRPPAPGRLGGPLRW